MEALSTLRKDASRKIIGAVEFFVVWFLVPTIRLIWRVAEIFTSKEYNFNIQPILSELRKSTFEGEEDDSASFLTEVPSLLQVIKRCEESQTDTPDNEATENPQEDRLKLAKYSIKIYTVSLCWYMATFLPKVADFVLKPLLPPIKYFASGQFIGPFEAKMNKIFRNMFYKLLLGLRNEDTVHFPSFNTKLQDSYVLVNRPRWEGKPIQRFMLCLRGTFTLKDVSVDLDATSIDWNVLGANVKVHKGTKEEADRIFDEVLPIIQSKWENHNGNEEFELRIAGHSLGAAVAEIITLKFLAKEKEESGKPYPNNVKCVALAPPPIINTDQKHIKDLSNKYITIFVNENDAVPQLSLRNATWLFKAMKYIYDLKDERHDVEKCKAAIQNAKDYTRNHIKNLDHPTDVFHLERKYQWFSSKVIVTKRPQSYFSDGMTVSKFSLFDHIQEYNSFGTEFLPFGYEAILDDAFPPAQVHFRYVFGMHLRNITGIFFHNIQSLIPYKSSMKSFFFALVLRTLYELSEPEDSNNTVQNNGADGPPNTLADAAISPKFENRYHRTISKWYQGI